MEKKSRVFISSNLRKESVKIDFRTGKILEKRIDGKKVELSEDDKRKTEEDESLLHRG